MKRAVEKKEGQSVAIETSPRTLVDIAADEIVLIMYKYEGDLRWQILRSLAQALRRIVKLADVEAIFIAANEQLAADGKTINIATVLAKPVDDFVLAMKAAPIVQDALTAIATELQLQSQVLPGTINALNH